MPDDPHTPPEPLYVDLARGEVLRGEAAVELARKRDANRPKRTPYPASYPTTWFDALREGHFDGYGRNPMQPEGVEITEQIIDDLAASVRISEQPVPMDGANVSGVHDMPPSRGGADAAGWITDAAKVMDDQGRAHLWLYGQVPPDIGQRIDEGKLAYGSVAFGRGADPESGRVMHRLHSYALTNTPFIPGLTPHRMGRTRPGDVEIAAAVAAQTKETLQMSGQDKKTQPGSPPSDPQPGGGDDKLRTRLSALLSTVLGEEAVKDKSADELVGLAEQAGKEHGETIRAAIAGELVKPDPKPAPQPDPAPAGGGDDGKVAELQAQLTKATETITELTGKVAELGEFRQEHQRQQKLSESRKYVLAELTKRRLAGPKAVRATPEATVEMVVQLHADHGKEAADKVIAGLGTPPQGAVMDDGGQPVSYDSPDAAINAYAERLRKDHPDMSKAELDKLAMNAASKDLPHLFNLNLGEG